MNMRLDPSVKAIRVGLNWNSNEEKVLDLDLSVFLLDDAYLARGDGDYVFYNNAVSENGAVELSGDDRRGEVDGVNESLFVDLEKIPDRISKLVLCVTFDDSDGDHIFGEAKSAVLTANAVTDTFDKGGVPFCSVDLAQHCPQSSGMAVLELGRGEEGWEYSVICESVDFGITELCSRYGLAVED